MVQIVTARQPDDMRGAALQQRTQAVLLLHPVNAGEGRPVDRPRGGDAQAVGLAHIGQATGVGAEEDRLARYDQHDARHPRPQAFGQMRQPGLENVGAIGLAEQHQPAITRLHRRAAYEVGDDRVDFRLRALGAEQHGRVDAGYGDSRGTQRPRDHPAHAIAQSHVAREGQDQDRRRSALGRKADDRVTCEIIAGIQDDDWR